MRPTRAVWPSKTIITTQKGDSVLKTVATALIAASVCVASTAFANDIPCTPGKVAGSYIRLVDVPESEFIDQVQLHTDGTAYFHQSTANDHIVTVGSSIPMIGTWKCVDANTLVMTTIGQDYHSEGVPDPFHIGETVPDSVPDSRTRLTLRFDVLNKNTLERNYFVFLNFDLAADPLDPNATPIYPPLVGTNLPLYSRVKVVTSDLLITP